MPYEPDLSNYFCAHCRQAGVKLWRKVHDGSAGWCSRCATAMCRLPDDIGPDGRRESDLGRTDQIYHQGTETPNLLPWVVDELGETWGYSSVPQDGVDWWRALPNQQP